jgi:hypothetical protein
MSDQATRRTIYVFAPPQEGSRMWYRIEMPVSEEFGAALGGGDKAAWHGLLGVLHKLILAAER